MHEPHCPHCGSRLLPFSLPETSGWQTDFQLACFNDDCEYYRRGWAFLEHRYGVKASYRYRVDPASGHASPLAVWSRDAVRDRILDAEVAVQSGCGGGA